MKVISFMGGGVKGMLTLAICNQIEKKTGKKIKDIFDIMVGTSTGSIIAAGLALGISAEEMMVLYQENISTIFRTDIWAKIRNGFNLKGPKYSRWGLDEMLKKHFAADKIRLSEISGPMYGSHIILTSFDTLAQDIVLFDSADNKINDVPLITAIGASASAPTYMPAVGDTFLGIVRSLIDGGIYAGSPASIGQGEILKQMEKDGQITYGNHILVSVGTGLYPVKGVDTSGWGIIDWLTKPITLLDMIFRAIQKKDHYLIRKAMRSNFIELDADIGDRIPMDETDPQKLKWMSTLKIADHELNALIEKISL